MSDVNSKNAPYEIILLDLKRNTLNLQLGGFQPQSETGHVWDTVTTASREMTKIHYFFGGPGAFSGGDVRESGGEPTFRWN